MQVEAHLQRRPANFTPLTPVDFLKRAVEVFGDKTAVVSNSGAVNYREFGEHVGRFAAALQAREIGRGDVVSVLAANTPDMLAIHYAVPMLGAVLNTINTRLDAASVAYILDHAGSALLLFEAAFAKLADEVRSLLPEGPAMAVMRSAAAGGPDFATDAGRLGPLPLSTDAIADEWQPICINYTSGTTGHPKGVIYHHRGAFLNSLANVMALGFDQSTKYLWVVPMFHCNGWQHPWAVTAAAGTHVCIDPVTPAAILEALDAERITHFCCAPVVLYMLLNEAGGASRQQARRIRVGTGGAAPTSALIEGLRTLGIEIVHLYGLTESYGPATLCRWDEEEGESDPTAMARYLARQGTRHATAAYVGVVDQAGAETPADAATLGEIVMRSNTLMAGYHRDAEATERAFAGDVFHTGDLAVRHPDGAIEIKDRSKDIIISGGENISSLEVESVLHQHPAVLLAAVVALPDEKWGEVPCACIELKTSAPRPSEAEIVAFCRSRLAGYKLPRKVVFREIPKTATGKVQKYRLREIVRSA